MSEMQDLKKEAERVKTQEQFDALSAYVDTLSATITYTSKRHRDSSLIYIATWIVWCLSSFLDNDVHYIFTMAFIFALIYDQFRFSRMMRAYGEFNGCIETLRLLGMIPPAKGDTERKKRTWAEGLDIVKGWFVQKKKAQDTAYVPA